MHRILLLVLAFGCGDPAGGIPPTGASATAWRSVSAGTRASCGVPADGTVVCWGDNTPKEDDTAGWWDGGEADPPPVTDAVKVSLASLSGLGSGPGCALLADGAVVCWGALSIQPSLSSNPYTDVAVAGYGFCGLYKTSAGVDGVCAGDGVTHVGALVTDATRVYPRGGVVCHVNDQGDAACALGVASAYTIPPAQYKIVSAGLRWEDLCGLSTSGVLSCWRWIDGGPSTEVRLPDEGELYREFCLSDDWGCGVDMAGRVECFGQTEHESGRWPWSISPPDDVAFSSISCGAHHACGLTDAGDVRCFGNDDYGQASPP